MVVQRYGLPCMCSRQSPSGRSWSDSEARFQLLEASRRKLGAASNKLEQSSYLFLGEATNYSPKPRENFLKSDIVSAALIDYTVLFEIVKTDFVHTTH